MTTIEQTLQPMHDADPERPTGKEENRAQPVGNPRKALRLVAEV
jgi:hypothetical protein